MANQTNLSLPQSPVEFAPKPSSSARFVNSSKTSGSVDLLSDWLRSSPTRARTYENCTRLQQSLQRARCRSTGNLFSSLALADCDKLSNEQPPRPSSSTSAGSSGCLSQNDDDDYAATSDGNETQSVRSSSVEPLDADRQVAASGQLVVGAKTRRKEVLLRVEVLDDGDESEQSIYINPSVSLICIPLVQPSQEGVQLTELAQQPL